jgi:hypothetical protein
MNKSITSVSTNKQTSLYVDNRVNYNDTEITTTSNINKPVQEQKKGILGIIANDSETRKEIENALVDYEEIGKKNGINAQVALGAQYIASDIQKTKAMNAMAMTMKDLAVENKAYQSTLGRKLTDKEVQDFKTNHSAPSLFDDINDDLLEQCVANLNKSRALTKK